MTDSSSEVKELYKTAVEMADRISARRGQANQFYLTLQTLLLGAPAIFETVGTGSGIDPLRSFLLSIIGIVISITWWLQLRSYRDLNRAKFMVINSIEADHFTVKPFSLEWEALQKDPISGWRSRYAELGTVERLVPFIFLSVNLVLAVATWL